MTDAKHGREREGSVAGPGGCSGPPGGGTAPDQVKPPFGPTRMRCCHDSWAPDRVLMRRAQWGVKTAKVKSCWKGKTGSHQQHGVSVGEKPPGTEEENCWSDPHTNQR